MKTIEALSITACILMSLSGVLSGVRGLPSHATPQTQSVRLVDNADKTVTDTLTGLMWAVQDNGADITWDQARQFCEDYEAAGYSDWRMPTKVELSSLYDPGQSQVPLCDKDLPIPVHVTPFIQLSCYVVWSQTVWLSEIRDLPGTLHVAYNFGDGKWHPRFDSSYGRALPVRTVKK